MFSHRACVGDLLLIASLWHLQVAKFPPRRQTQLQFVEQDRLFDIYEQEQLSTENQCALFLVQVQALGRQWQVDSPVKGTLPASCGGEVCMHNDSIDAKMASPSLCMTIWMIL